MDKRLRLSSTTIKSIICQKVSILGLVDKRLRPARPAEKDATGLVSILGLVDKRLRPVLYEYEVNRHSRFNPWFSG